MKLQVFKNGKWAYVFCRNAAQGIITTQDKMKALGGRDYQFFISHFANDIFRLIPYGAVFCNCHYALDMPPSGGLNCETCGKPQNP